MPLFYLPGLLTTHEQRFENAIDPDNISIQMKNIILFVGQTTKDNRKDTAICNMLAKLMKRRPKSMLKTKFKNSVVHSSIY